MTIDDLVKLLEARTVELTQQLSTVATLGDVASLMRLECELLETETTLIKLRSAG